MRTKTIFHIRLFLVAILMANLAFPVALPGQESIPHLRKKGTATQLMVNDRAYMVIGGELHNSSTGSLAYMKPLWKQMAALNVNTVLPVVSWEMIEPEEGNFDFTLVDAMIEGARAEDLRLIPLWFGTWKNGMSSYVPLWVKQDHERFPRMKTGYGEPVEIISTFSQAALDADIKAFSALMRHIRKVDGKDRTVIMVQVENEVGMLGDSRDRSEDAEMAFRQEVPEGLISYLNKNRAQLAPELFDLLGGRKVLEQGSWEEVFGPGIWTDNIFMAWQYASYMEKVTAAGKAEYDLPMYVNAWLELPGMMFPGKFPSGGPLPRVLDIWRAAAPSIDFYTPDIYADNFADWCDWYTRNGNPLFIPETRRTDESAANMLFAFGNYNTIGTSPFGIDDLDPADDGAIEKLYKAMQYLGPVILDHQGEQGKLTGFLLDDKQRKKIVRMGDYEVIIELYSRRGVIAVDDAFGIVIRRGEKDFTVAGSRALISFRPLDPGKPGLKAGLGRVTEIVSKEDGWTEGRILNGDETHRGRAVKLPLDSLGIQKVTIYDYL